MEQVWVKKPMLDFAVVGISSSSCTLLLAKASTSPTEKRKPKKKERKAVNMTVLAGKGVRVGGHFNDSKKDGFLHFFLFYVLEPIFSLTRYVLIHLHDM
jgi:hypothetical protein